MKSKFESQDTYFPGKKFTLNYAIVKHEGRLFLRTSRFH